MSLLSLCSDDTLVSTLRRLFKATPVLVPEESIRPLCVVARQGRQAFFRGNLRYLLANQSSETVKIKVARLANLAGQKSKSVDASLGLNILDGFLSGFGVPSAGILSQLTGVKKLSFSFRNVQRRYVDINELGYYFINRCLDLHNPANRIFFTANPCEMLLISSIITSTDFSINIEESNSAQLELKLPEINQVITESGAKVNASSFSGYDLSFQGEQPLTFAFTTVKLYADPQSGAITSVDPTQQVEMLTRGEETPPPAVEPFTRGDAFLIWDREP